MNELAKIVKQDCFFCGLWVFFPVVVDCIIPVVYGCFILEHRHDNVNQ